jgi:transposase InsO family protein
LAVAGRSSTEESKGAPTIHLGPGLTPHDKAEYIDAIRHVYRPNDSAPFWGQAHISFNGKFRDECLNDHYFNNLEHARAVIAAWRRDYNETRPHSAIGRIPPAEFAARHRSRSTNATEPRIV